MNTLAPKSILVVDDDPHVASTLRLLLIMDRHQVEVVRDGKTALARYKEGKYDLVITDLFMPGVDGLELAKSIMSQNPQQLVLMVSGHLDAVCDSAKMLLKNFDCLLMKPFSRQQLQESLGAVFFNS
jgi:DNA-binding response OmpR family regulator